jgi:hypothetical protein
MTAKNMFQDVKALGQVMKELMEMGTEDGRLGLQQPSNWSPEAVDFLSLTMTASPTRLAKVSCNSIIRFIGLTIQHPFLRNSPQVPELVWLISLAQRSASWFYSVTAASKDSKIV